MSYAVKIGTTESMWIGDGELATGWVRFDGELTPTLVWGDDVQNLREPNAIETLQIAQQAKINSLKQSCTNAIQSGFTSDALGTVHTYDSELPTDQTNIIGSMVAALGGASIPFTCTDSNGYKEQRLHTSAQLQQVFTAGMQHIVVNKSKYDVLKKQVEQATTVEAVSGINW